MSQVRILQGALVIFPHKSLPRSTFHDLDNKGRIVPIKELRGYYLLNPSLRKLGLPQVSELPNAPESRSMEDIIRLAFTLIDPSLFPEPACLLQAEIIDPIPSGLPITPPPPHGKHPARSSPRLPSAGHAPPSSPAGFLPCPPHDGRSSRIPSPSPPTRPHPNPFAQASASSPQAAPRLCPPARPVRSISAITRLHRPAGHAGHAARPTRRSASSCLDCLR